MTAHAIPRLQLRRRSRAALIWPFTVAAAAIVASLTFVSYVLWPSWPGAPVALDAPEVPVTVAGVLFEVPPAAVRVAMQRQPGPHERLDLVVLWPSLAPPSANAKGVEPPASPADASPDQAQISERLFVTISGLGTVLAPVERLHNIYPRYVEATASDGGDGLAVLPFRAGTPYAGEDLVYLASDPEAFFARCTRQVGVVPGTCIHERAIDAADITLRFPRRWLDNWRSVSDGFDQLIAQLHPQRN